MKKTIFTIVGSTILLAACNNGASDSSASTEKKDTAATAAVMSDKDSKDAKEARNKKIIAASMEAFNNHDVDGMMKDADPNTVEYGDGMMKPVKGVDSVKTFIKAWVTAMPDTKGEDLKIVADGDWVMVWGKWSGTWKAELMGMKPTGKPYKVSDVDIFKMSDDGKILEHHNVLPGSVIAMQVGMKMGK
jgi:predicted ester cyclase